jgi:hypothetical protein
MEVLLQKAAGICLVHKMENNRRTFLHASAMQSGTEAEWIRTGRWREQRRSLFRGLGHNDEQSQSAGRAIQESLGEVKTWYLKGAIEACNHCSSPCRCSNLLTAVSMYFRLSALLIVPPYSLFAPIWIMNRYTSVKCLATDWTNGCGAHPTPIQWRFEILSREVRRWHREAETSPPTISLHLQFPKRISRSGVRAWNLL